MKTSPTLNAFVARYRASKNKAEKQWGQELSAARKIDFETEPAWVDLNTLAEKAPVSFLPKIDNLLVFWKEPDNYSFFVHVLALPGQRLRVRQALMQSKKTFDHFYCNPCELTIDLSGNETCLAHGHWFMSEGKRLNKLEKQAEMAPLWRMAATSIVLVNAAIAQGYLRGHQAVLQIHPGGRA